MVRVHSRLAMATAVVLVVSAVAVVGLRLNSAPSPSQAAEENAYSEAFPPALAAHLQQLSEAMPGNGGENGPGSAEDAVIEALAFPDNDIPLARIEAAQAAFTAMTARGFKHGGAARTGTWTSVGPSHAVYPFFAPRDLGQYVPNEYLAGGRTLAMLVASTCQPRNCRMWIAPAGGGIWRTDDALATNQKWQYLSGAFAINSSGALAFDPNDATGNTIWAGTGEGSTCGSGCVHGEGLYRSTDGGDTWSAAIGASAFKGRGVGSIVVTPGNSNVLYASSTMGLHGMSSVCCSGIQRIVIPGAKLWGLYKSTDGGATWTFIHAGSANPADCGGDGNIATVAANATPCTPRGTRQVVLDPTNPTTVYAASYARGVWRSTDAGTTWTQIKASLAASVGTTRPAIAVTTLASGKTRMYVGEGNTGGPYSRLFRSDDVATGVPTFTDMTSSDPASTRYGSFNFCTGQCWYDAFVYSPKGFPDWVYLGGSYQYGNLTANHRAVVLSRDAGESWNDMTADSTDPIHPNALHPDQHVLVTNPNNPLQFFEGNDGGVMRSSGQLADGTSTCTQRGLDATRVARCQQMLSQIPTQLSSMNKGLTTLQFQSLSVSPFDPRELQGGTQDNGTWENYGSPVEWKNTMIGDGGQSGFDATDPHFRFHNFFNMSPDVNFSDGATSEWIWIADPIFGVEGQEFYVPMISDPNVSKTLFVGGEHVWRTKTAGFGTHTMAEMQAHCNEWTGDFVATFTCGDWEQLGAPLATGDVPTLTGSFFGDRSGGNVVAVERARGDNSTLWAATTGGRVFVSKNADAAPSAVSFARIDSLTTNDPNRFVSSIYIDPANSNHAWISYSGFNAATPATPGHVFEVTYNPVAGTATWGSLDALGTPGALGDIPVTDLVRDDNTGDIYTASDYGVMLLASGSATWTFAAPGMPKVEVAGLTIVPNARKLYAATHGLGAWVLGLP
jgi:hypothetical protein